ncbi:teichoic acid D-Ala incorporation-associated protein DltX [Bacillus sp. RG28]|uniref:Teichoic acid D-Ala incorporation-associated protein DltX n=1 Tax=Gottfriedia endophytica TaxID=2820819 RepID=A0A940NN36_9BACI|nr:teichoic acid D-Ala incorporation-associated protein DltX [Gottfriedia endophytica]MBP0725646.1 teichoic acid D-Ala incorporation-associated protein DltX [Gottfriedia endophytica]
MIGTLKSFIKEGACVLIGKVRKFFQHPITQWITKTSYYLLVILLLIYFYVCNTGNSSTFIYNEF